MKLFVKHFVLSIFICVTKNCIAQIQGTVIDDKSRQPIPFCGITVKNTSHSTIANENGVFVLRADTTSAVLVINALGYKTKFIPIQSFLKNNIIYMEMTAVALNEVAVSANTDYLYNVLDECRTKIVNYTSNNVSKVYLGLETKSKQQPAELLEIYYNGYFKGIDIDKLLIKNGRVAWSAIKSSKGNRYYLSLSTTLALMNIDLVNKNKYFAAIPLQFNKRKMKHFFNLSLLELTEQYTHIAFKPSQDLGHYFSGEVWVDKQYNLLKIQLNGENISVFPFVPIIPSDSISNFSIQVTEVFKPFNSTYLPSYINFSYQFDYKSTRDSSFKYVSKLFNSYNTKGILYFYEYSKPFILPYFDYDPTYDDYKKISFIPYNTVFWNTNNKVPLTESQKQDLGFFTKKEYPLNYNAKYYWNSKISGDDSINIRDNFFENYNIFWSSNHRLSIFKSIENNEEKEVMGGIPATLYDLNVQILLDVTRVGDSLYHNSYTIFDRHRSYFNLPRHPASNCFINIYFDLCEIERRKMEEKLSKVCCDLDEISAIYKQAKEDMHTMGEHYFNDVFLGKNIVALEKWNSFVKNHLGINNMQIYYEEMKTE